jgi:hypothetical protein
MRQAEYSKKLPNMCIAGVRWCQHVLNLVMIAVRTTQRSSAGEWWLILRRRLCILCCVGT